MRSCVRKLAFAGALVMAATVHVQAQGPVPVPGGGGGTTGTETIMGYGQKVYVNQEDSLIAKAMSDTQAQNEAEGKLRDFIDIIEMFGGTVTVLSRGITYSDGTYYPLGSGHEHAGKYVWNSDYTITVRVTFPAPPGPVPVPVPVDSD